LTEENEQRHEFRPRPEKLTSLQMLKRILWNPQWNESLFMVSCAERIIEYPSQLASQHNEDKILKHITRYFTADNLNSVTTPSSSLQFRLITGCSNQK